jgi:CheY-like chemotaxis protein
LVEDSATLIERLSETLQQIPEVNLVGIARPEKAAIAFACREAIDVIILDLHLKDGTGFGVMRALAPTRVKPQIVVLTTRTSARDVRSRSIAAVTREGLSINERLSLRIGRLTLYQRMGQRKTSRAFIPMGDGVARSFRLPPGRAQEHSVVNLETPADPVPPNLLSTRATQSHQAQLATSKYARSWSRSGAVAAQTRS